MRLNNRFTAAIVAVAAIFLLITSLYLYSRNIPDTQNDNSSSVANSSEDAVSSGNGQASEDASDIISNESSEDGNPSSIEVILYNKAVQLDLSVNSAYVAAAYSDHGIIFQKNTNQRCYPASLTKLLTVSTAARYVDEDYLFTVGDELDLIMPGSTLAYLNKGDILSFRALTDALLLPSGNDAAYVMAVGVGRKYAGDNSLSAASALEVFMSLMNKTADDLGCTGSSFITPDGYHNDSHYTTATDMLKIAIYASGLDIVRNSVKQSTARHVFYSGRDVTWVNTNLLLNSGSSYYYNAAIGMKTGTTDEAGRCLIAIAQKNGKEVIAVLMNASSDVNRYNDAIAVLNAALESS